jgi:hypothetical protein
MCHPVLAALRRRWNVRLRSHEREYLAWSHPFMLRSMSEAFPDTSFFLSLCSPPTITGRTVFPGRVSCFLSFPWTLHVFPLPLTPLDSCIIARILDHSLPHRWLIATIFLSTSQAPPLCSTKSNIAERAATSID